MQYVLVFENKDNERVTHDYYALELLLTARYFVKFYRFLALKSTKNGSIYIFLIEYDVENLN